MNETQRKLIDLSTTKNIWKMTLREIGKEIGVRNAASVKYHLDQLKEKGLLNRPPTPTIEEFRKNLIKSWQSFVRIPVLGKANCGVPLSVADEMSEGYLQVSPRLLPKGTDRLFALKTVGDSMNMAKIKGQNIDDGDYVVIDKRPITKEDRYVLSIIDGCANIKRLVVDRKRDQIALVSESRRKHSPIYIHKDDDFLINGAVVAVIKKPKVTTQ